MTTVYWFRKALRLGDNPSLLRAIADSTSALVPVFIIDPHFRPRVGPLRYNHLIDTLVALNADLERIGSGLVVLEGTPVSAFESILDDSVRLLVWEKDTEAYARERDAVVRKLAEDRGVDVMTTAGHTLYDFDDIKQPASIPTSLSAFRRLLGSREVPKPVEAPAKMPPLPVGCAWVDAARTDNPAKEMGAKYKKPLEEGMLALFEGGEQHALAKMKAYLADARRVTTFEKPKTDPTKRWYSADTKQLPKDATTALSPYLHFGSLSARVFYWALVEVEKSAGSHTTPPVSLVGQLLWREFFHYVGFICPFYDRIQDNPICRQIPWSEDVALLEAWKRGRTGYPWIDAIMTQLRNEGWIHHLARHCVACFLTRGDLYQSWEKGAAVFDEFLIDADWSLNNANWMWLSCSAFFSQYWRVYSPVAFGKKYDPEGEYIKHFLPALKHYPKKYIYEPWKASKADQKKWKCIIGEDYPAPIVDHSEASTKAKEAMKKYFADKRADADAAK